MTKAEQTRVTAWRLKILRWSQDEPRQEQLESTVERYLEDLDHADARLRKFLNIAGR